MQNILKLLLTPLALSILFAHSLNAKTELGNIPINLNIEKNLPDSNDEKSNETQKKKNANNKKIDDDKNIKWLNNINTAFANASSQFRPVMILFSSTHCPWCVKLKNTTLKAPEVTNLLSEFITVNINVDLDKKTASLFGIRGIPVIVITNSDGRELIRTEGFISKENMLSMIDAVLNKNIIASKKTEMAQLLYLLKDHKIKKENWRELMASLGKYPDYSDEVFTVIRNYRKLPLEIIVELLSDTQLTVRLGALEVLEELAGTDNSFDPWHPAEESNFIALDKWKKWAESRKKSKKLEVFAPFSKEQCMDLIRQALTQNSPIRAARAKHFLRRAGNIAIKVLNEYINQHPNLPNSSIKKIKELQYSLYIPDSYGKDPVSLAHKIVFGKLDTRLDAVEDLKKIGPPAYHIIKDQLNDPNPLIREAAVDSMLGVSPKQAINALQELLEHEKDNDVIFSVLRVLGKYEKNKNAHKLLVKYLESNNEDHLIAALEGLTAAKYKLPKKTIHKLLTDSRWRVRAQTLEFLNKTNNEKCIDDVKKLLRDNDNFVKTKAIFALASISPASAVEVFEKLYFDDSSVRISIIKAYMAMEHSIPKKIMDNLKQKNDDSLLQLANLLTSSESKLMPIAELLVKKKNPDLRVPALRYIASFLDQDSAPKYIKIIIDALKKNDRKELLPILQKLKFLPSDSKLLGIFISEDNNSSDLEELADNEELSDLFSSFDDNETTVNNEKTEQTKKTSTKTPPPSEQEDIATLFDAFDSDHDSNKTNDKTPANLKEVFNTLETVFENNDNLEIKLFAAAVLLPKNKEKYEKFILENFAKEPLEIKLQIFEKFNKNSAITNGDNILMAALNDKDKKVATEAMSIILSSKNQKLIKRFLDALQNANAKPYDISLWELKSALNNEKIRKIFRKKALQWLKNKNAKSELTILATIVFAKQPYSKAIPVLIKHINSPDKYVRRAAYYAIFMQNKKPTDKILLAIQNEKDPFVKLSLPAAYMTKISNSSTKWFHYFDEKHHIRDYIYDYSNKKLPKKIAETIYKFTESNDKKLRFESYLTLLYARKKCDLNKFLQLANSFPDTDAISEKITNFFESNLRVLGNNFITLIPLVDQSSYKYDEILDHFKIKKSDNNIIFAQFNSQKQLEAQFIKSDEQLDKQTKQIRAKSNLTLVFFEKPGCADCAKVKKLLEKTKYIFPALRVEKHNIDKISSMRINEAYCEKFNVPSENRLVAPALFAGSGFLIKHDITESKLVRLIANSISVPLKSWHAITKKDIKISAKRIEKRYEKTNIWLILLAGLLDGVNPCAFATIIFFISYLRIRRKNAKEILLVGISFITAVFLAYLAFGFGLNQIIVKFYKFDAFRLWFNRAMALFVLIIMLLSLYDAIICLKGNIENISLQLPNFIKERIRSTIRIGSSNTHYIIAAFIMGCVISFLELSCTGQVYAPMIAYMWQTGSDYYGSIFYLIAYNIAFILPLIAIFASVLFGMKNETINDFFHKHAALVKFSTAILFLIILISIYHYNPSIIKF